MELKQKFNRLPLGLPLTVSGLATIATIFAGKKCISPAAPSGVPFPFCTVCSMRAR